jgi:hypothetical protein
VRPVGNLSSEQAFAIFVSALGPEQIEALTRRLKAPKGHGRLAGWVVRHRPVWSDWRRADADALIEALEELKAFKPDGNLETAFAVGTSLDGKDLAALAEAVSEIRDSVRVEDLRRQGLEGPELGQALHAARRERLRAAQKSG